MTMIGKADAAALAALTALLLACGSANEEPGQWRSDAASTADRTGRYADQDRDGKVTRAEAQADPNLAASFERYDTDGSGALERGEFARLEADSLERMRQADTENRPPARPRREFARPLD
jgi:hypothetical protein